MEKGECSKCRFCVKLGQPDMGECHRFPPTPFLIKTNLGSPAVACYFPMVMLDEKFWCGEFESTDNLIQ
jgi:hypothetical protein